MTKPAHAHAASGCGRTGSVEQVFRHKVFRMLLDEEAVTEDLVKDLLSWHHSGFSAHVGKPIPAGDTESLENLAQYIVRPEPGDCLRAVLRRSAAGRDGCGNAAGST